MTTLNTADKYAQTVHVNVQKWKLPFWFTLNPYLNRVKLGEGGLVVFNLVHSVWAYREVKPVIIEFLLSLFTLSALYAFNDFVDREADIVNPKKDKAFIASIIQYPGLFIGLNLFWTITAFLFALYFMGTEKAILVLAVFGINTLYSKKLKAVPVIDILTVIVWGGLFTMLAGKLNWMLGLIAGAMTGIAHIFQIITDKSSDERNKVKTSIVALPGSDILFLTVVCFMLGGLLLFSAGKWWGLTFVFPLVVYWLTRKVQLAWYLSRMYFFICWLALLNLYYGGL